MDRSNRNGKENDLAQYNHLQLFIWRIPKKNHDAMVQNCKRASDAHRRHGQRLEFFELDSAVLENGLVNMTKVVPSSSAQGGHDQVEEVEVWLELNFHEDRKHMDEVAVKRRMEDSDSADPIGKQFMNLISPGTCIEGGFTRIRV